MVSLGSSSSNGSFQTSPPTRELEELRRIYGNQVNNPIPSRCYCSSNLRTEIFWGEPDPGRRFVACPKVKEEACGFFQWIDPTFPYQASKVILELLEMKRMLNDGNMVMERTILKKDAEIDSLTGQFLEAKGFAEYLSGIDEQRQRDLTTVADDRRRLLISLKYHKAISAMLMVVVAAFLWTFK